MVSHKANVSGNLWIWFCIVSFMKVPKQAIEKYDCVDFTFYSLLSQESVNNRQNCLPV